MFCFDLFIYSYKFIRSHVHLKIILSGKQCLLTISFDNLHTSLLNLDPNIINFREQPPLETHQDNVTKMPMLSQD